MLYSLTFSDSFALLERGIFTKCYHPCAISKHQESFFFPLHYPLLSSLGGLCIGSSAPQRPLQPCCIAALPG